MIIHYLFYLYSLMLLANIAGSWFPGLYKYTLMKFIAYYTNPYLNIFRRIIPPIGGVLDISPLLAFITLQFLEKILRLIFI